jgi:hypothetical protein
VKKIALLTIGLTLGAGALLAPAGIASAQYYSGPGYGVHIGPRYEEPRYYRYGRYDDGRRYYRRAGRCPPHYTVQDGVCKPYRGY